MSRPITGLQKGQQWSSISVGSFLLFLWYYFLIEPVPGTRPRHGYESFPAKYWKIWLPMGNITSYLSPKKSILRWKLSNFKATTEIARVFRTKTQMFTPSFSDGSWIWHTCCVSPFRAVNEVFFLFFAAGNVGTIKAQISKNKKWTAKYLAKTKTPFVDELTGAHKTRVQKFEIYLLKTAWTSDSQLF